MKLSLKASRINAGYSLVEAAEKLKVSGTTIWRYETGQLNIRWAEYCRMCELYGIKPEDTKITLVGDDDKYEEEFLKIKDDEKKGI